MPDDNNGQLHQPRAIVKSMNSIEGLLGEMVLVEVDRNEILKSIAASLASLDSKTPALPGKPLADHVAIAAEGDNRTEGKTSMNINPSTPVKFVARYTLDGAAGSYEGAAKWSSVDEAGAPSAKDTFVDQIDDNAGGIANATLNGTGHVANESSTVSVSADVEEGAGDTELSGTAEIINWTPSARILANGVTVEVPLTLAAKRK